MGDRINSYDKAFIGSDDELVVYDPDEFDVRNSGYSLPKMDIFKKIKKIIIKICTWLLISCSLLFCLCLFVLLGLCVFSEQCLPLNN